MAAAAIVPPPQEPTPLSEPQRLIDTFIAPSKTFIDLRRNASWWGPYIIIVIIGYLFIYAVDQKVTFQTVVDNSIRMQPKAQAQLDSLPPGTRQDAIRKAVTRTKFISYSVPVIALIIYVIFA